MTYNQHLSEEKISRLAIGDEGEIPPNVRVHLDSCEQCRRILDEFKQADATFSAEESNARLPQVIQLLRKRRQETALAKLAPPLPKHTKYPLLQRLKDEVEARLPLPRLRSPVFIGLIVLFVLSLGATGYAALKQREARAEADKFKGDLEQLYLIIERQSQQITDLKQENERLKQMIAALPSVLPAPSPTPPPPAASVKSQQPEPFFMQEDISTSETYMVHYLKPPADVGRIHIPIKLDNEEQYVGPAFLQSDRGGAVIDCVPGRDDTGPLLTLSTDGNRLSTGQYTLFVRLRKRTWFRGAEEYYFKSRIYVIRQ
jgi:hypothetical protein